MDDVDLFDESDIPIHLRRPAEVLVPILPEADNESMLKLASWLSREQPVLLLGVVPVPEGGNLSGAAMAASELRLLINRHVDRVNLRARARIRVSYTPWEEIRAVLADEAGVRLLVLNWPHHLEALRLTPAEILSRPPCDVAIVRGPLPDDPKQILVPMRGGPHAEQALRLALEVGRSSQVQITALRLRPSIATAKLEAAFAGMAQVLAEMPRVRQTHVKTDDQAATIVEASRDNDLVILGTSSQPAEITSSFGQIADTVLKESAAAVIAVKTKRMVVPEEGGRFGYEAISVLVDRWFAENTFHAEEFADLRHLLVLKEERGLTISLALPALNEEKTVGDIIRCAQRSLMEQVPLLDEIVLMDSNSTDGTREIAADLGVPVYIHQEVLPQYGARVGKGEALWKSLYVTQGDIIIWADTDVSNFHPRFIYGLLGPLLQRATIMFVKGFYQRPLKVGQELQEESGGRVTELTARPLLNLFYPGLSGIIQPLSGEYGGRREALEQLSFSSGYGVEISLLIDVFERLKLSAIGQVDMLERVHRNQSLQKLSRMSFAIIQTLFRKLEARYGMAMLQDINRTMKIVRQGHGHLHLQVDEIAELERPPMIDIPEYRQARAKLVPEMDMAAI
jgi:glucosyl-3-phosphoglycerate synthase